MLDGNLNFSSLMENAKEMMGKAQEKLAKITVTGEAGAGMVKITMTAKRVTTDIHLDDELLTEDKSVVIDLLKAALNDANSKIEKVTREDVMSIGNLLGDVGNAGKPTDG